MKTLDEINRLIAATEAKLAELEIDRAELLVQSTALQREKAALTQTQISPNPNQKPTVANQISQDEKIALFRRLLRGRGVTRRRHSFGADLELPPLDDLPVAHPVLKRAGEH